MENRKPLRIALVLFGIAVLVVGCAGNSSSSSPDSTQPSAPTELLETGRWESFDFTSQALADNLIDDPATRTMLIYLPPGYDKSNERYPVVYGLHGYLEDPTWLRVWGRQLDALIASGEAREMILVLPDGDNKFGGSWYQSSPTIGDYESYIAQELVGYIDANYRTSSNRDARGIAGCSMGGNGALHLALQYPDIFGAAASVSGGYAYEDYPQLEEARAGYSEPVHPRDLDDIPRLNWFIRVWFALAAAAAPNPDSPPLYLDMPFEIADGEAHVVPEVLQEISDIDVYQDLQSYLDQPIRLRGIAVYHGVLDEVPIDMARSFSEVLTERGVEHEYAEVDAGHCGRSWDYSPLLKFMSETLGQ